VDIVVTDGFNGNVALKTMEGFASFMLGNLREMFGSSTRTRLAYLLMRKISTRCASGSIRRNTAERRCSESAGYR